MNFLLLSFFVSLPAHAYNVIEMSPGTSVELQASSMRISFDGAAAKTIYDNLAAAETQMDAEGYTFEKVATGFLCQSHFRSTYDCVTWVDPAKGIIRQIRIHLF
jgi:hypothetical protein